VFSEEIERPESLRVERGGSARQEDQRKGTKSA